MYQGLFGGGYGMEILQDIMYRNSFDFYNNNICVKR